MNRSTLLMAAACLCGLSLFVGHVLGTAAGIERMGEAQLATCAEYFRTKDGAPGPFCIEQYQQHLAIATGEREAPRPVGPNQCNCGCGERNIQRGGESEGVE